MQIIEDGQRHSSCLVVNQTVGLPATEEHVEEERQEERGAGSETKRQIIF